LGLGRILWKILPYCLSVAFGFVFLVIGFRTDEDVKSLLINISAAFFALPLIYLFYQQAVNFSQKRLNKEIFDYAKMQIDTDILSILNQLQKTVQPLSQRDSSLTGINNFISQSRNDIKSSISNNSYLGFQVLKKWEVSESNLHKAIQSNYMHRSLNDDQIISIITIIKGLRALEALQQIKDLHLPTGKGATGFTVVSGKEMNKRNTEFPDRYILLKDFDGGKFLVMDFGDFAIGDRKQLLMYFSVNEKLRDIYSDTICNLIDQIRIWLKLTGSEFLIDEKMFRMRAKPTSEVINSTTDS
jgi:hypothetical protein